MQVRLKSTWRSLLAGLLLLPVLALAADPIWIDVRSAGEWQSGHLEQALHVPHTEIGDRIADITADKDAPIYLYCRSGRRAGVAKEALEKLGYTNVTNVGGYEQAKAAVAGECEPASC
ncbi:rhodanese-like domain-containing protein [Pseudomaricurvus sp. HS19]|uniref:rhodanese-like domain-containing protein n=1 Tax=Pseudomaricurvus sp. HS19 TaxID=2692626 RepID=UPI00136E09BD|nr:rhodanese-like domain-containing protein [Pseudomaricurvus sp. HS19]MYM64095.1 rhodanese-like domain-containing protein [Pseudomaricurvus sp. HS19]